MVRLTFKGIPIIFDHPQKIGMLTPNGYAVRYCRKCEGILDYTYAHWFQCRSCGRWWRLW
jgi:hypothetical protein